MNSFKRFFASDLTSRQKVTRRAIAASVAVGALLVAGVFTSWLAAGQSGSEDSASRSKASAADVDVSNVRLLEVVTALPSRQTPASASERYTGIIVPRRTSQLAAKALARVDRVLVDVGDSVEQGELLVQLDREQLEAELEIAHASLAAAQSELDELVAGPRRQDIEQAEYRVNELAADLNLAKANHERIQTLRGSQAVSIQELDESRFQVAAMQARLAAADQQLALLREGTRAERLAAQRNQVVSLVAQIKQIEVRLADQQILAPYGGQIQRRRVDEGEVVAPGTALLEIVETSKLEIEVGLPVRLVRALEQLGRKQVKVQRNGANALSGSIAADLTRISPVVDAATRTMTCVFEIAPSHSGSVSIGDSVSVVLPRQMRVHPEDAGWWVPSAALAAGPRGLWTLMVTTDFHPEDQTYVLEQRPVELLRSIGEWSMVRGTIGDAESFVAAGVHRVVAGQRVKVVGTLTEAEAEIPHDPDLALDSSEGPGWQPHEDQSL